MKAQIDALISLQELDLALEVIKKKKGALPEQIKVLEGDLENLEKKKDHYKGLVAGQDEAVAKFQEDKTKAEALIKQHKDSQVSASDNRDYDVISREIALQELEIQLAQKNIKQAGSVIKEHKEVLSKVRVEIRTKKDSIKVYKEKLKTIQAEVKTEEAELTEKRPKIASQVPEELYHTYENMRRYLKPSYVVTHVKHEACGGCYYRIPPQQQIIILEGKKIIQCEFCNRILAKVIQEAPEEKPKKKRRSSSTASKTA